MITFARALHAAQTTIQKAEEMGVKITVSIVDAYGIEIVTLKMDNALPVSPEFARTKAYTSAVLRLPTAGVAQYAIPGQPFYGTASLLGGKFNVIPGGLPVSLDGKVVGAVGVGGSHDVAQDVTLAEACVSALTQ